MAQTYKFGNGTWANKEGSTLAYNDEGNNYKPLPFSFERDSIATRVNKEGLIEVVGKDIPRIDYTDSADGVLLLENSSTNLVTYSEDFSQSYWATTGSSVQGGFDYPSVYSNLGSFKLIEDTSNSRHGINHTFVGITSNTDYSFSINIKPNGRQWVYFKPFDWIGSYVWFDVLNGVVGNILNHPSFIFKNAKINKIANGFFNVSFSVNTTFPQIQIGLALTTSNDVFSNYIGDGASGVYIYGAQLEQNSFSTSYIPTSGSTVPRAAETANGSGNSEVFNDSEGVLFVNHKPIINTTTNSATTVNNGTANRVYIGNNTTDENLQFFMAVGGSSKINVLTPYPKNAYSKIAFSYKSGNSKGYVNGFQIFSDNVAFSDFTTLNKLSFNNGSTEVFKGSVKEVGYYDTILTDAELEYMTSYRSLNELVTELNLNTL